MSCFLVGCCSSIFGRVAYFFLWLTGWFWQAGIGFLWVLIGFLFAPMTLIFVGCVNLYFGGHWGIFQIVILIICLMGDMGSAGGSASKSRRH